MANAVIKEQQLHLSGSRRGQSQALKGRKDICKAHLWEECDGSEASAEVGQCLGTSYQFKAKVIKTAMRMVSGKERSHSRPEKRPGTSGVTSYSPAPRLSLAARSALGV